MTPPKLFSEFYDQVNAWAKKRAAERLSESIKKTMATEERLAELSELVARGHGAKKFIESDFWLDHIQPFLRSEAVLKPAVVKSGDANPLDRINVEFLIGSGKVLVIAKFIETMDEWQARGAEAEKIIKLEADKRKRLREAGA